MKEISTIFDITKANIPKRREVEAIIGAALNAADTYNAVVSNIQLFEKRVIIGGFEYSLPPKCRLVVIGLGKAAPAILNGNLLVTLATDGEDGPTDAAGAVVDGNSLKKANSFGLDPDR
jgi:glycerate-2-kinase